MLKKSLAGLALGGSVLALVAFKPESERYFEIAKNLDIFATLFKEVNTYYVDDVEPNKMIRTGIDAMLKSLDPYTNYIPEDDIEDFRTMTTGQYGGIGAIIGKRDGKVIVQMPYEDFPAHKAGLQIGDEIVKIDGVKLKDKNTAEVSKLLKGQANTEVKVEVLRFGQEKPLVIPIMRDQITVNNVPYFGMVTADIGYLQLAGFTSDAAKEVKNAVVKLKEKGAKKIILDVRDNPGGLLHEAVNISNLFVDKGQEIVSTKGKVSEWNKVYKALDEPLDTDIPIAVLTSSRSASASEIVSGVFQDYDRAVLIGERTFGKGLVQATRPLSYNSQLKVTTAKYYIPSGRCIQAIDYSHRNADGSASKTPDSLRVAFKTENGRLVYDGGGVSPDIEVEEKELSEIAKTVVSKGYVFDFATQYRAKNPSLTDPKKYKMSDAEYQQFVAFVQDKDVSYSTSAEEALEELVRRAKADKHYDDIQADIEDIKQKMLENKNNDLQRFSAELKEILEQEIVSRYYLQKGIIEASFDDDADVLAAIEVLNDSARYNSILKGQK